MAGSEASAPASNLNMVIGPNGIPVDSESDSMRMIECCICYNYPLNAVESGCCSQIVCQACVQQLSESAKHIICPLCRQEFSSVPVKGVLKRMIDNIGLPCKHKCGEFIKIGNIKDHNIVCAKRPHCCKFCSEFIVQEEFHG